MNDIDYLTAIANQHAVWNDSKAAEMEGTLIFIESVGTLFMRTEGTWLPLDTSKCRVCLEHADCRANLELARACYDSRGHESSHRL